MARTGPEPMDLTIFLVEKKTPGITITRIPTMAGYEAEEVVYDGVRVPAKNIIGKLNRGLYQFLEIKPDYYWEKRPGEIQGRMRRILELLVQYVKETEYNGKPLSKDPLVRQKLAQLAMEIEAIDLIGYRFSWMQEKGLDTTRQSSISKLGWNELYVKVGQIGMQILGQYGTLRTDSKYAPLKGMIESIYGASQLYHFIMDGVAIQRNFLARTLDLPVYV
jgi:alkylation response protein AidB-like acyl-CoA dehydrogenase